MADIFSSIAPYLGPTGTALVSIDENETGADDCGGELLIYAAEEIAAISMEEEIPPIPDIIRSGTTDKISGAARVSLIVANSILTVAQFQVSGKAAKTLKYINMAIRNLLAGAPV